jgi:hypothetical protein
LTDRLSLRGSMFLEGKVRKQIPRQLQEINILVMQHPYWEQLALMIFRANGRCVKFEVDPEIGLTDVQIADLCVRL